MQPTTWSAVKSLALDRMVRWRCRLAFVALALSSMALTACDTASYERSTGGGIVYLDQRTETAKAQARQQILQALQAGSEIYHLGIGDEIAVFFVISHAPTSKPYVIVPGDKVRIAFLGEEEPQTLQVRPDGRISLPLVGAVVAAGQTASALSAQLQQRYSGLLTGPKITVSVTQAHTALDDFLTVLSSTSQGRSITDRVLPDGTIALPLLPPLQARGRTLKELEQEIDAAYEAKGIGVTASLVPRTLRSNAALVIGEVTLPGRLELERPLTIAMAVARAGGILPTGSNTVRMFYVGPDGQPRVRSLNLKEVLDDFRLEDDMIVPANSIIYVPPTELAQTGRLMDAVLRDILRFQGFSIGSGFAIP